MNFWRNVITKTKCLFVKVFRRTMLIFFLKNGRNCLPGRGDYMKLFDK